MPMTASRLKKHALLLAIAIGVIVLVYALAIVANAYHVTAPRPAVANDIVVGGIALALSLPLLGLALVTIIRPKFRALWRTTSRPEQIGILAYLALDAAAAVAAWTAFFIVASNH